MSTGPAWWRPLAITWIERAQCRPLGADFGGETQQMGKMAVWRSHLHLTIEAEGLWSSKDDDKWENDSEN